jgi:hypothetical protein
MELFNALNLPVRIVELLLLVLALKILRQLSIAVLIPSYLITSLSHF